MKFLVDAQLPKKLAGMLIYRGYDAQHTLDLPNKNTTTDREINLYTIAHECVLISKDRDFVESMIVSGMPYKLVYVNTGNITNKALITLFAHTIEMIVDALNDNRMVELTYKQLIVHA
ncbi:MAG: DUF5615 family PIN-like protein [Sulfurovum sp.]|nr:DUF5615 family PIN-like protein [Sulfurovum sp.]